MSKTKEILFQFNIFLILLLINVTEGALLVKAVGQNSFRCENDILYVSIDVDFSGKPKNQYYPFILELDSPENLKLKCVLEYANKKINCLHSFTNENDFIEEDDIFKFPITFPEIDDIQWDYQTFLNEVFRRVYNTFECGIQEKGKEDKKVKPVFRRWDIEGNLISIIKGKCEPTFITQNNYHKYNFELIVSFNDGENIDNLLSNEVTFLQDIWVPLTTEKDEDEDLIVPYAYCGSTEKLNKNNNSGFKLQCYIEINRDAVYNNIFQINTFFDEVYIKNGDKIDIIKLKINSNQKEEEESTYEEEEEIICPSLPFFTLFDKESIYMGEYNESDAFSIYLFGTLTNGYYTFKNGTNVELKQTYKDIKFNLVIQDNFITTEDNYVNIECTLPEGTIYDEEDEAIIKCIGKKMNKNNVDIVINWNLKDNNNFNNIIIKWPKSHDKKKNLYGYDIDGISIKQSDYGCRENNLDFYVYIYDLGREPKIVFELPLDSPKGAMADCKLFDRTTLKCSLNLKHKKLSKGTKITLPEKGIINVIETMEGNKINFLTNNFTQINNEKDISITLQESCGDYLVVGTLKDFGMSHKTSVITYIIILVVIFLFIVGIGLYIAYRCKLNYERGTRLVEESKADNKIPNMKK